MRNVALASAHVESGAAAQARFDAWFPEGAALEVSDDGEDPVVPTRRPSAVGCRRDPRSLLGRDQLRRAVGPVPTSHRCDHCDPAHRGRRHLLPATPRATGVEEAGAGARGDRRRGNGFSSVVATATLSPSMIATSTAGERTERDGADTARDGSNVAGDAAAPRARVPACDAHRGQAEAGDLTSRWQQLRPVMGVGL